MTPEFASRNNLSYLIYDRYFSKFKPKQQDYYLKNIYRQVVEAFIFNGLYDFPVTQVCCLVGIQAYFVLSVYSNKPYAMLAQSRSELITVTGRFLVYSVALIGSQGVIAMSDAATSMVNIQMVVTVSNVFTQM